MRGKVTEGTVKKGGRNEYNENCSKPPAPRGSGGKFLSREEGIALRDKMVTARKAATQAEKEEAFNLFETPQEAEKAPLDCAHYDQDCAYYAKKFEKKHGKKAFLKVCGSATNLALVEKGILTELDLRKAFLKVLDEYKE